MPGLADLLSQALSISPGTQRRWDAERENTYYPGMQDMLTGMGRLGAQPPPSMPGGTEELIARLLPQLGDRTGRQGEAYGANMGSGRMTIPQMLGGMNR